jgi:hypothetical protein
VGVADRAWVEVVQIDKAPCEESGNAWGIGVRGRNATVQTRQRVRHAVTMSADIPYMRSSGLALRVAHSI